jgi:hypothetical protein
MATNINLLKVSLLLLLATVLGCSTVYNPVNLNPDNMPGISESDNMTSNTGIFGSYELSFDPESLTADLISKRIVSIGESWSVNGKVLFDVEPCRNCLNIRTIDVDDDGNAILTFTISHPFPKGTSTDPITAVNRADLDVFDMAMVILPEGSFTSTTYDLGKIYSGFCYKPDGYTRELANMLSDQAALPYFLVIDESNKTSSTHDFNRFEMGTVEQEFDIVLASASKPWTVELFLTLGYGFSAKKFKRFEPKYFLPEFNRKSAWKVNVIPPEGNDPPSNTNTWVEGDTTTTYPVTVQVWDWQQGAAVSVETKFSDSPLDQVYAASNVAGVKLEIPGMYDLVVENTVPETGGTGLPGAPLVYIFNIANEENLVAGEYIGIVKVSDERSPSNDLPPTGARDYLITSETGTDAEFFKVPEYATYQTFTATVVAP